MWKSAQNNSFNGESYAGLEDALHRGLNIALAGSR